MHKTQTYRQREKSHPKIFKGLTCGYFHCMFLAHIEPSKKEEHREKILLLTITMDDNVKIC